MYKTSFLWPCVSPPEANNNPVEVAKKVGLIINPKSVKRDEADSTLGENGRIVLSTKILCGMLQDQANIGRLFQYVVLLANQRLSMCTPQILYYILDSKAGPKLIEIYPGPMKELLRYFKNTLIPDYKKYFASNDAFKEQYN